MVLPCQQKVYLPTKFDKENKINQQIFGTSRWMQGLAFCMIYYTQVMAFSSKSSIFIMSHFDDDLKTNHPVNFYSVNT